MRIGNGYDVHKLAKNRELILGGVKIPFEFGLDGHSDADALTHSIMDALLGAAGLRDIGFYFPDSNSDFKGISSMLLLSEVKAAVAEAGFSIGNIDSVIVAQRPKLAPFIDSMKAALSACLGIDASQISIKATTEEGLGFTGQGLGISAYAVCLLERCQS
ncbi:MAG: 2-C-methyl-D-erythritol 2,4-cyclodiphosphate synthase [Clostridiales bacterium]|nr:2-C-methyl-D-erythritol 2,4-cyclodiphosphate synthase [Clostridiales bacterium]